METNISSSSIFNLYVLCLAYVGLLEFPIIFAPVRWAPSRHGMEEVRLVLRVFSSLIDAHN